MFRLRDDEDEEEELDEERQDETDAGFVSSRGPKWSMTPPSDLDDEEEDEEEDDEGHEMDAEMLLLGVSVRSFAVGSDDDEADGELLLLVPALEAATDATAAANAAAFK